MRLFTSFRLPRRPTMLMVAALSAAPTASTHAGTDVIWPAGSTQFVISDLSISQTLTIEPGVTVLVNSGASIIVQGGGTLIVDGMESDPVHFTSNGSARWGGVKFQAGSGGHVRWAVIEHTSDVGVQIQAASPTIESSDIRDVLGASAGASARGVHVTGAGANPAIHACLIENIVGANGVQGPNTPAAANGADGADGTLLSHDGQPGGNGNPGAIGGAGAAGGWGYGIVVESGANAAISSNHIRNIRGGKGGKGGTGGGGGNGGDGGAGYNQIGFTGDGGNGGNGGKGGTGGVGGIGGWAIGVRLWDLPASASAIQNLVEQIVPGQGGTGGTGGGGGDAGNGGAGIEGPGCIGDTSGGDGGDGGAGGNAGTGGLGGTARAFDSQNGGAAILLVQNTAAAITEGLGGFGGSVGFGGAKGIGGGGGGCASDGAAGSNGAAGSAGSVGPAGTRNGAFAANVSLQLKNNIMTFGGSPSGTALVASGGGTITAGTNCFFGFASLSSGNVTVLAGNVLSDPLFADAAGHDYRLAGSSPAIDGGDNAAVPAALALDFDDLDRIADGDANGSSIVDMGAYESQPAAGSCPADSTGDSIVNIDDLFAVINSWGACAGCPTDITGDDIVNVDDLFAVINAWGDCPR